MINEKALWALLDQLRVWAGHVDYSEDSNYYPFLNAINQVMADLDADKTETPWWEQLPPHTPVQVNNERWGEDEWVGVEARFASSYDHVQWPPPTDNWAYAREHGYTHLVVWPNGSVTLTDDVYNWPDEAVLVPIPKLGGENE